MDKAQRWMEQNGYSFPKVKDLERATVEMKFSELFELMDMYALQHQLSEFKEEISKLINR